MDETDSGPSQGAVLLRERSFSKSGPPQGAVLLPEGDWRIAQDKSTAVDAVLGLS